VTLNDNQTFKAQIIGTDPTTDLALIKIDAQTAALGKQPYLGVKSRPPNQAGEGMGIARDTVQKQGRSSGMGDIPSPRAQMGA